VTAAASVVVFDLDGVLIDSGAGIRHSLDVALVSLGLDAASDDEARALLGPPLHEGMTSLLRGRAMAADTADTLVAAFRADYVETSRRLTTLYDGVLATIDRLVEGGHRVALATSKPRPATEPLLAQFGLDQRLHPIGCPIDVATDTKTDVLRRVLDTVGPSRGVTVMVGDRSHDMIAARALGVQAIGALWGYGTRSELIDAGAHRLAAAPGDLDDLVEGPW
jgi:phosphoglycolate phosphatase